MVLEFGRGHYYALMNIGVFGGSSSHFQDLKLNQSWTRPAVLSARPSFLSMNN